MRARLLTSIACCAAFACQRPPAFDADPQALAFCSRGKLSDQAARQIVAQAGSQARGRHAWSEAPHVHVADGTPGDGKAKYVFGEARLFLAEYEATPGTFREVDARDDALMAFAEARALVDELARWARAADAEWDVQLGARKGRVGKGGPDKAAQQLLADLAARAAAPADAAALERQRASIDQKYRDRR